MLDFFPLIGLIAAVTTIAAMIMLVLAGELRPRSTGLCLAIFAVAVYAQFYSRSPLLSAAGLGLQTLLAVALIVRWRLGV